MTACIVIPGRASARTRNPASFERVWIPGSACGGPGMTKFGGSLPPNVTLPFPPPDSAPNLPAHSKQAS
jgi:hypothetical protein